MEFQILGFPKFKGIFSLLLKLRLLQNYGRLFPYLTHHPQNLELMLLQDLLLLKRNECGGGTSLELSFYILLYDPTIEGKFLSVGTIGNQDLIG